MANDFNNLQNLNISNMSSVTAPSESSVAETIGQKNTVKLPEDKTAELCKKYNITAEELFLLLEKCQKEGLDIYQLPESKINELISSIQIKTAETVKAETLPEQTTQKIQNKTEDQNQFNHQEFSKLSVNEKIDVYALELAKNKFMFSDKNNKKSLEDWNKLSDQEKMQLAKNEFDALKNDKVYNLLQDDEMRSQYLQGKMLRLQTASFQSMGFDDFNNQKHAGLKIEQIHEYTDRLNDNNKTVQLNELDNFLEKSSELVIEYLKEEAKNNPEIQEKFGHLWSDKDTKYNLSSQEIENYLELINKNRDVKLSKTDLTLKVMESALKKDPNNVKLNEKYTKLSNFVQNIKAKNKIAEEKAKAEGKEYSVPDFGRISSIKADEDFGKLYESATTVEDKITLISAYINKICPNATPEEKANIIHEFATDLYNQGEEETSILFAKIMLGKHKGSEIENEITQNQDALAYTSVLSGDVSVNGAKNIANTQNEIAKENYELAKQYAHSSIKVLEASKNQENIRAVSSNYAGFSSSEIQDEWYELVKNKDVVTAETQMVTYADVLKLSNPEIGKKAAKNIDQAHDAIQLSLTEIAIQNKEYNNAMIEDGTFNRFAEENIVPAFKMHKERCLESDYTHEESVNTLNMLSDQIQNCKDYPDKQLEMHKEIMNLDQNKYSEVIEHAAGNIKNYDSSVQLEALDAVYQTGNKKAVDVALNDIVNYKSEAIKDQEFPKAYFNLLDKEKFIEGFLGGTLSLKQIAKLSPIEKQIYFEKLYKKASPADKLRWIQKFSNLTFAEKKSMYTYIAINDESLLKAMVETLGMGKKMLEICNDSRARTKIENIMKNSTISSVIAQYEEITNKKHTTPVMLKSSVDELPEWMKDKSGRISM